MLGPGDAPIHVIAVNRQRPIPDGKGRTRNEVLIVSPPQVFFALPSPRVKLVPPQLPWTNAQPVLKSLFTDK